MLPGRFFHKAAYMLFIPEHMVSADPGGVQGAGGAGEVRAFLKRPAFQEPVGKAAEEIVAAAGGVHRSDLVGVGEEPFGGVLEKASVAAQLQDHVFYSAG